MVHLSPKEKILSASGPDDGIHSKLDQQLRAFGLAIDTTPSDPQPWRRFLRQISKAYNEIDMHQIDEAPSFRRLIESAPELIFSLSAHDGRITSLSPSFESLTGYSRETWIGNSLTPLLHPADLERTFVHLQEALTGRTPPVFEARWKTRSGNSCATEIALSPLRSGSRVIGIRGSARDLLRTPKRDTSPLNLSSLLGEISEELHKASEQIGTNDGSRPKINRLQRLNDRLHDLMYLHADRSDAENESIDLRELVEEVEQSFAPTSHSVNLRLRTEEPPRLLYHRPRLLRLLVSLGAHLAEQEACKDVEVLIEALEVRPGLCEIVFTLRADILPDENLDAGKLIGELDRRLIESMGGEIQASAHYKTFIVRSFALRMAIDDSFDHTTGADSVPDSDEGASASRDRETAKISDQERLTVLVAEDHAVHRKILSLMLGRLGHEVDYVNSGLDVIDLLVQKPFDLVMLDRDILDLNGIDTCRSIRSRNLPDGHTPRIILMGEEEPPTSSAPPPYDAMLRKPIQAEELEACIQLASNEPETDDNSTSIRLDPLRQLFSLRPEVVTQLVDNFLENASEQAASLAEAIEEKDFDGLQNVAHSLKGSSATLGATGLSKLCLRFEQQAREKNPPSQNQLEDLRTELATVKEVFHQQLKIWTSELTS